MRRHLDYYTGSDQSLKDRSRFWTWYMRGLHGDMDTRFEGDRRLPALGVTSPRSTVLVPEKIPVSVTKPLGRNDGLRFVPLNSNTYGYHPKGISFGPRPARSIPEPGSGPRNPTAPALLPLEKPWKDWSTPLKSLDDLLLNPPRALLPRTTIPRRHWIPPRTLHFDPELDDLLILEHMGTPMSTSSEALEAAEKALATLKSVVGTYKPYDTSVHPSIENLQNYIDSLRMATRHVTFAPDVY